MAKAKTNKTTWIPTTRPKIFMIFMTGSDLNMRDSGRNFFELADELFELLAAIFVVSKLIETGEAGAEQNVVAADRGLTGALHGIRQVCADRLGDVETFARRAQERTRLADQKSVFGFR